MSESMILKINEIHADEEFNCRGKISPIDVIDLAKGIAKDGLLQPIVVAEYTPEDVIKYNFKYKLIMGFRRFMAHIVNQMKEIKCEVRPPMEDRQARVLNLLENINRKNLNIVQEAKSIKSLKDLGATQEMVADELQMSKGWVQVRFMLLDLPEDIQQDASAGFLTQYNIRELYALKTPEEMYEAVKKIKTHKLSGSKKAFRPKRKLNAMTKKHRTRAEIFQMMDHIQAHMGNNIITRTLAWSSGEINDYEFHVDLKSYADGLEKNYAIPAEIVSTLSS